MCAWKTNHEIGWIREFFGQLVNKARASLIYNVLIFQLFIWRCWQFSNIWVIFLSDIGYRTDSSSFFLIWWTTFKIYWVLLFICARNSKLFLECRVSPKLLTIACFIRKGTYLYGIIWCSMFFSYVNKEGSFWSWPWKLFGIGFKATWPLIGVKENDSHIIIYALSLAYASSISNRPVSFLITISLITTWYLTFRFTMNHQLMYPH